MRVSLTGPDDLGYWFLDDENGNSFPLVEAHEDHSQAAALLGWKAPEGVTDEKAINDALDWLNENAGEEFNAPKQVVDFFKKLKEDEDE